MYDAVNEGEWHHFFTPYPTIYWHAYTNCSIPQWAPYDFRGDRAEFAIWEEDKPYNPDDRVAKWRLVPTDSFSGNAVLCSYDDDGEQCSWAYITDPHHGQPNPDGWPGEAKIRFRITDR